MTHEVKLEVFEGPIDLLLHLITRQRVDIYDVSLSSITEEYLKAVEALDHLDLEAATGFLVIAATLLELKSARLLPARGFDGEDSRLLEERDLLLARLVECSTFREAGAWIARGLDLGRSFHGRDAGLEPRFVALAPDLLARVGVTDIALAAGRALMPKPELELDVSHVALTRASVRDAILELSEELVSAGSLSFERLCGRLETRLDIVVRFLALLELFKAGAVELDQADRFGDITASWTGEVFAQDILEDVEEYALEGARGD